MRPTYQPSAKRVLPHSLTASAAVGDAIRRAVNRVLRRGQHLSYHELLSAVAAELGRQAPLLAQVLADSNLANFLTGAQYVALASSLPASGGLAPPPGGPPTLISPFGSDDDSLWNWDGGRAWLPLIREAVRDLQDRRLVLKPEFEQLSDAARRQAFTVAGLATEQAVGVVRDAAVTATATGQSFPQFYRAVVEDLGTSAIGPGHLENVFRTNSESAVSRGMDKVLDHPLVGDEFPYDMTIPIPDSRLTILCEVIAKSGIHGTNVYRRDDPVWLKFKPPRHWQCRCSRRPLSVAEAAAKGIREAQVWLRTGMEPFPPAFVPHPENVDLPRGWVSNEGFMARAA